MMGYCRRTVLSGTLCHVLLDVWLSGGLSGLVWLMGGRKERHGETCVAFF